MFNKKYFFSLMLLLTTTAAFADYPNGYFGLPEQTTTGFYINGQVGEGFKGVKSHTFYSPMVGTTLATPATKETGFAGRLAIGYDVNPFLGFELGGSIWTRTTVKWNWIYGTGSYDAKADLNNGLVDLLVTLNLPVYRKLHVFGKGGLAYLFERVDNAGLSQLTHLPEDRLHDFLNSINTSQNALAPELALGLGYQWSEHWDISLNYAYVFSGSSFTLSNNNNNSFSSNHARFPILSMLTLGVEWDI